MSAEAGNVTILNKNEKKARELIPKLGLKPLKGISRVTFRKKDNQIVAIDNPEVYKTVGGNYVVFGEAKVEDFTQKLAAAQQQVQTMGGEPSVGSEIQKEMEEAAATKSENAQQDDDGEEGEIDAGDLAKEDITLVMEQASVSRNKAVKALKDHNGDIVNAIMSLSK